MLHAMHLLGGHVFLIMVVLAYVFYCSHAMIGQVTLGRLLYRVALCSLCLHWADGKHHPRFVRNRRSGVDSMHCCVCGVWRGVNFLKQTPFGAMWSRLPKRMSPLASRWTRSEPLKKRTS
jgi:hypothetical protein